jgi:hypothetical protein
MAASRFSLAYNDRLLVLSLGGSAVRLVDEMKQGVPVAPLATVLAASSGWFMAQTVVLDEYVFDRLESLRV